MGDNNMGGILPYIWRFRWSIWNNNVKVSPQLFTKAAVNPIKGRSCDQKYVTPMIQNIDKARKDAELNLRHKIDMVYIACIVALTFGGIFAFPIGFLHIRGINNNSKNYLSIAAMIFNTITTCGVCYAIYNYRQMFG
jgi:hypothetical protein